MLSQRQWHKFTVILQILEELFYTAATEKLEVSLALRTGEIGAIKQYTHATTSNLLWNRST